jgi:hypothetical protein
VELKFKYIREKYELYKNTLSYKWLSLHVVDIDNIFIRHVYLKNNMSKYYEDSDIERYFEATYKSFNAENLDSYCYTIAHMFKTHGLEEYFQAWCSSEQRRNKINGILDE